jgi:hypothetical protein
MGCCWAYKLSSIKTVLVWEIKEWQGKWSVEARISYSYLGIFIHTWRDWRNRDSMNRNSKWVRIARRRCGILSSWRCMMVIVPEKNAIQLKLDNLIVTDNDAVCHALNGHFTTMGIQPAAGNVSICTTTGKPRFTRYFFYTISE